MTHEHGLQYDLHRLVSRRSVLNFAAVAGTAMPLAGCFHDAEANVIGTAADGSRCINMPLETAGPFPADGSNSIAGTRVNLLSASGIVRKDIRNSIGELKAVAQGAQLDLSIKLVDVKNACKPLSNFALYIWHCDAPGQYSMYERADANYLRGVGMTNEEGTVDVTTVFPGCYSGRWPHIHFEVFNGWKPDATVKDSLLISQFALPADVCGALFGTTSIYSAGREAFERLSLASDGIFANNTPEQLAAQTLNITGDPATGYKATVTVGLLSG